MIQLSYKGKYLYVLLMDTICIIDTLLFNDANEIYSIDVRCLNVV